VLTDTLIEFPVVPEEGFTDSQEPPVCVLIEVLKDRFGVPPMVTDCGVGAVVPI